MIVCGVDPGDVQSALVLYEPITELILHKMIAPNGQVLTMLRGGIDHLAIEQVQSYGMPVGKEVFEMVWWAGRFYEVWNGPRFMIPRMRAKMHLCGSSRAKDSNIRQALIDKLGPTKKPGPLHGVTKDMWAALAIAVTYAETREIGTPIRESA